WAQGLAAQDYRLRVWQTQPARECFHLSLNDTVGPHAHFGLRPAFTPDGTILAVAAGETVRVYDLQGRLVRLLRGHRGEILDLAFAPDGRSLVTASEDGTAL